MTLPTLEKPSPTPDELMQQQQRLHEQADRMLAETGLLDLLARHGEISPISGSYTYGLMVYPDLDLGLVSRTASKPEFADLVHELVGSNYVRKVSTADTVNFPRVHPGRPKGYWLGLEIPYGNDRWGIDCWLQRPEWQEGETDPYPERLSRISHQQVLAILAIKHYLIFQGIYGKTFYSVDVYDDVLDHGALSVEDFKESHSLN